MIHSEPIDGLCPRCHVALVETKTEYEEGFTIYAGYFSCPQCDWQPGDTTVHACDYCETITNDLADFEGDEYCTKCHRQQTTAKLVKLITEAAMRVNFETNYCVNVYYSGHIHTFDVSLYDHKDCETHTQLASSSVKLCADWFDDETALKAIYLTLTDIALYNKLPEQFKTSKYGWMIPEVMAA